MNRSSSRKSSKKSKNFKKENEHSNGPIFEIKFSNIMGRYIVAKGNLEPGDVVLSEEPIVVGPCVGGKVQCLGCYRNLEDFYPLPRCEKCKWPFCETNCPGLNKPFGHTKLECGILEETKSANKLLENDDFEQIRSHYNAIVPFRCLLLKKYNPKIYEIIKSMENHNVFRKQIKEVWETNQKTVVDRIRNDWGLMEFDEDEIHSICGALEVNSFEIGQQGVNIRGLYPTAFLLAHDCVPNTNHCDDENYNLTIRASIHIQNNHPITLSYAYTLQSTLKRREHLLENKFFECNCARCSDPTELGTYSGALLCPKCQIGWVLSINPLDPESSWKCNGKNCPGYSITAKSIQLLTNRITEEIHKIDCNDIEGMEKCLQKYRNVLHPTHYLCLGIKLSLSQLYGKINGYLIYELNDSLLERKQEICEEILKVFDVIEPGYTRLRGVTLYELHAPLMILLSRQFESQKFTKSALRARLRHVVKCLHEANIILNFEPEQSAEWLMGMAAKDALIKIKDWEKILGKI